MSTRSTLTIRTDNSTLHFYRHMDGYVAGAGQTLQVALEEAYKKAVQPYQVYSRLVKAIMMNQYPASEYRSTQSMYEVTEHAHLHSDREYHYDVYINKAGYVNIEVEAWLPNFDEKTQRHEIIFNGGFDGYKDLVTKEMVIIAERVAELEKKRGA